MQTQKIKQAIAVYNPQDPLEKSIQNSYNKTTNKWLDSGTCQLVADAISALKLFQSDWLNGDLNEHRVSYFFEPNLCYNKSQMVFMTYPLFLGDIIENLEINSYVHSPVVFVTPHLSHFLFPEYTKKIILDMSRVKGLNDQHFVDVGGLMISEQNVILDEHCIVKILDNNRMQKAAATEISRDVFAIEEIDRNLLPGDKVWDKKLRKDATIELVEPGSTGTIIVKYQDETSDVVAKADFDKRFSIV